MQEREQRVNLLKEWLQKHEVSVVLFDLDDTIINTSKIFRDQMRAYANFIASRVPNTKEERVWEQLEEVNDQAYLRHAVNPRRWRDGVINQLAELYDEKYFPVFSAGLPLLMRIYQTVPEFRQGAVETLVTFRDSGIKMGLVTHANENWTWFKINAIGLQIFFNPQNTYIVNENKHKGPEDWAQAVSLFGVQPEQAMIIGDSLPGDIVASAKIGVIQRIWVPSEWKMYNLGDEPEGTIKVENIGKVIETLIGRV